MPKRYALYDIAKLTDRFNLKAGVPRGVKPSRTVNPTDKAAVIVSVAGVSELRLMGWGLLPANSTNTNSVFRYKTYETKSETIFNKHSTAKAVRTQRCIVPANGFYEWQKIDGAKQPFFITPKNQELCAFAGIYSSWHDADSTVHETFSIITIEANADVATIDARMPVILHPDNEVMWLDPTISDVTSIYSAMRSADNQSFTINSEF